MVGMEVRVGFCGGFALCYGGTAVVELICHCLCYTVRCDMLWVRAVLVYAGWCAFVECCLLCRCCMQRVCTMLSREQSASGSVRSLSLAVFVHAIRLLHVSFECNSWKHVVLSCRSCIGEQSH
jgi:hypothetical protein